jgi:hypothetical protein
LLHTTNKLIIIKLIVFSLSMFIYSCYRTHAESKGVTPLSWPVFLAGLNESRDALLKKLSEEQAEMGRSSTAQPTGMTYSNIT